MENIDKLKDLHNSMEVHVAFNYDKNNLNAVYDIFEDNKKLRSKAAKYTKIVTQLSLIADVVALKEFQEDKEAKSKFADDLIKIAEELRKI